MTARRAYTRRSPPLPGDQQAHPDEDDETLGDLDGLMINGRDPHADRRAESRARQTARFAQEAKDALGKHQGKHISPPPGPIVPGSSSPAPLDHPLPIPPRAKEQPRRRTWMPSVHQRRQPASDTLEP